MKITVFCGSSSGVNPNYTKAAYELGLWMAKETHTLIYGGSKLGLMGILANTILEQGGEAVGIMPTCLMGKERVHSHLTSLVEVPSISIRKEKMMEEGELFIALPGGPGTLEEMIQVISWIRIGQCHKKAIFLNIDQYYDAIVQMMDQMVQVGFLEKEDLQLVSFVSSVEELKQVIK